MAKTKVKGHGLLKTGRAFAIALATLGAAVFVYGAGKTAITCIKADTIANETHTSFQQNIRPEKDALFGSGAIALAGGAALAGGVVLSVKAKKKLNSYAEIVCE